MQEIKEKFIDVIRNNEDNDKLSDLIKDTVEANSKKQLESSENKLEDARKLFLFFITILYEEDLYNKGNFKAVVNAIISATSYKDEQILYQKMYEKEKYENAILNQKEEIYKLINNTFDTIEEVFEKSIIENKDIFLKYIDEARIHNTRIMKILKETTEVAFLTLVEKGEDIEDTAYEVSKNIVCQAINEGNFTKKRILNIVKIVIDVAINIADRENKFLAQELLTGVVDGVQEGIEKSIDNFKEELKYLAKEEEYLHGCYLKEEKKYLFETEEAFIDLLKTIPDQHNGFSKQIFIKIIDEMPDSYFVKMKRLAQEASENIAKKMEHLKDNALVIEHELKEKAQIRLEGLKKDMKDLEIKANEGLRSIKKSSLSQNKDETKQKLRQKASEKIAIFKEDMKELEAKANEAIKNFKESQLAKNTTNEAKRLTENTWKKAKEIINNATEAMKK